MTTSKILKTLFYCAFAVVAAHCILMLSATLQVLLLEMLSLTRDIHGNLTRIDSLLEKLTPRDDSIIRKLL